eukprot:scaffold48_cov311-Pinguiococcus_pyrenoidosus.AAC.94
MVMGLLACVALRARQAQRNPKPVEANARDTHPNCFRLSGTELLLRSHDSLDGRAVVLATQPRQVEFSPVLRTVVFGEVVGIRALAPLRRRKDVVLIVDCKLGCDAAHSAAAEKQEKPDELLAAAHGARKRGREQRSLSAANSAFGAPEAGAHCLRALDTNIQPR